MSRLKKELLDRLKYGDKVYFEGERNGYTVMATDNRYAICTKPYNPKKTVLYTIVDQKENIRGTNNLIFNPYDYQRLNECLECLDDLRSGETKISYRNRVPLVITKTIKKC